MSAEGAPNAPSERRKDEDLKEEKFLLWGRDGMMTVAALIRPLVARPAVRESDEDCERKRKREKKG